MRVSAHLRWAICMWCPSSARPCLYSTLKPWDEQSSHISLLWICQSRASVSAMNNTICLVSQKGLLNKLQKLQSDKLAKAYCVHNSCICKHNGLTINHPFCFSVYCLLVTMVLRLSRLQDGHRNPWFCRADQPGGEYDMVQVTLAHDEEYWREFFVDVWIIFRKDAYRGTI